MAEYILDVMSQTSKLDWAFPFQRTGAFPIDRSAVFSSFADAQKYALGDGSDERELGGTSYVGQIISVYEAGEGEDAVATANAYIITPARGLMKLASTTASGDIASDVANLQGEVTQVLSNVEKLEESVAAKADAAVVEEALALKADADKVAEIEEAVNAKVGADEVAAAVEPKADKTYVDEQLGAKADAETVNNALAEKANVEDVNNALAEKANAVDVYVKNEVYTKTEVETYVNKQIGSAGHLNREIVEALPEVEAANVDTIYMVKKSGGLVDRDHYEEYMVINGAWEVIGDTFVDLSNYVDNDTLNTEIGVIEAAIALKADASALESTNAEIAKKADAETVNAELAKKADAETVNGALDLKADKTQVATDIENAVAPLAIKTEVESALLLKADKSYVDDELAKKASGSDYDSFKQQTTSELLTQNGYIEALQEDKADKAETLEGYGITDAYTKEEVDAALLLKSSQQDHNALVDVVNKKANAEDVYSKTEADAKFAEKADTLAEYGITDAYTKSETYSRQEIADLIADITGGESAADVLAALNTYKGENDERVGKVEDRVKALEDLEADDNTIEAIKVAGATANLEIVDKVVTIPAAASEAYGLVKLSEEVGVNDAGALEVKNVNANKIVQETGEWLILNGGSASI